MKKRLSLDLSDGPSLQRRQHTPFARDVLTPPGAPVVARHRTRPVLTSLAVRLAILDDAAAKPESVRVRSLRRRLTAIDRALSDREAEMLERLTSCMIGLSNVGCVDYLKSEIRSSPFGRLPFGEARHREIAAMAFVSKWLSAKDRAIVLELAAALDPSRSVPGLNPGTQFVEAVRDAARAVVVLYEEHSRLHQQRSKHPRCGR